MAAAVEHNNLSSTRNCCHVGRAEGQRLVLYEGSHGSEGPAGLEQSPALLPLAGPYQLVLHGPHTPGWSLSNKKQWSVKL